MAEVPPAVLTEETASWVHDLSNGIMEHIDQVPLDHQLRTRVALICGVALGLAIRVDMAEKEQRKANDKPA